MVYNTEKKHLFLEKMNVQMWVLGKKLCTSILCEIERDRLELGRGRNLGDKPSH